jgi:hypothetical protein
LKKMSEKCSVCGEKISTPEKMWDSLKDQRFNQRNSVSFPNKIFL